MGIFDGAWGKALGFRSLEESLDGMPPLKRAKKLQSNLQKEPKADQETMSALTRSIAIIERNKNKPEELFGEFMRTRDMMMNQPMVWLNLALHVSNECGSRIYEFPDFSIEGRGAIAKAKEAIQNKSANEKKFFDTIEQQFRRKAIFTSAVHPSGENEKINPPEEADKKAA